VSDLAKESGVSARTINRIEVEGGVEVATKANLKLIRETLEAAGVEFVGGPGDGPGVRLWKQSFRVVYLVFFANNLLFRHKMWGGILDT